MDPERPHRSTSINNSSSITSELFVCFTSRLSSSSMKISSKCILSPGRTREPSQISLSASLSRRLRSNGSMKRGLASPMFPANGKKKGCAFENAEPSSPKVTCIGRVRVKTKKQGKKFRACRSKRRGEVSFRKVDHSNGSHGSNSLDTSSFQDYNNMGRFLRNNSLHHQQQQQQECKKWVHLPLSICEALRAFGAEFKCFLPCRSSCMANQRDKEEKIGGRFVGDNGNGNGSSSCGAAFAKWLVAVEEGQGKDREIELVVGGEDDERRQSSEMMRSSQRRHVFEDIEINDFGNVKMGDEEEEEEEEARVSICIPPKNALLLMRCRSDPVKMAALANKFYETPVAKDEEEEEEEAENESEKKEEEAENESEKKEEEPEVQQDAMEVGRQERQEKFEQEMFVSCEVAEEQQIPVPEAETEAESVFVADETKEEESLERSLEEEVITECQDQEQENQVDEHQKESTIKEENSTRVSFDLEENQNGLEEVQEQEEKAEVEPVEEIEAKEGEDQAVVEEEESSTEERSELECPETREPDPENESKESESQQNILPDCLLLMMCEPKLSMEVSKETWVCSTDFIRWVPEKKKQSVVKQKDGGDEPKRRINIDSNPAPVLLQPPRSSCSFPAAPPMATAAITDNGTGGGGRKVVGGKGFEPFALKRCKSEPRKSSAKLASDACFWKNRKLQPATLGVGAAGVGF